MQNQGLWGKKKKTNNIHAMSMDLELHLGRKSRLQMLIVATRHWGFMPGFKFYVVFGLGVALEVGIIFQLVNLFKRIYLWRKKAYHILSLYQWCSQCGIISGALRRRLVGGNEINSDDKERHGLHFENHIYTCLKRDWEVGYSSNRSAKPLEHSSHATEWVWQGIHGLFIPTIMDPFEAVSVAYQLNDSILRVSGFATSSSTSSLSGLNFTIGLSFTLFKWHEGLLSDSRDKLV